MHICINHIILSKTAAQRFLTPRPQSVSYTQERAPKVGAAPFHMGTVTHAIPAERQCVCWQQIRVAVTGCLIQTASAHPRRQRPEQGLHRFPLAPGSALLSMHRNMQRVAPERGHLRPPIRAIQFAIRPAPASREFCPRRDRQGNGIVDS